MSRDSIACWAKIPSYALLTKGAPHPLVSSTLAALGHTLTMEPLLILALLATTVAGLVSVGLFAAHAAKDR